ncbi:Glycosyl transferase, family 10 domain-containing protein [Rozella allomycis CSF55]|uniref:Fucosyltransferase n=1 Tax=Rozella allomycis (strain CSF55) TaxID=988480 RepID=A0A075AR02_ROZAC|nr:Glycosyl transferase, family 10 domain-containing protein [Rozella allomycis CSF55]|eukprot:EPZ31125.1 Glycosyl transferase, family 10 domain-containing protein [Rozella allomycis CSF55]
MLIIGRDLTLLVYFLILNNKSSIAITNSSDSLKNTKSVVLGGDHLTPITFSVTAVYYLKMTKMWDLIIFNEERQKYLYQRHMAKMKENEERLKKNRGYRVSRSKENPITIYSVNGNMLIECSIPCQFKISECSETADVILSMTDSHDYQKKHSRQARAVISLEPDLIDSTDMLDKMDIIIGFPKYAEIPINYFYGMKGDKPMEELMGLNAEITLPVWPDYKSKAIASTFISNCWAWQRNKYVEDLQAAGVTIDHFGGCTFGKQRASASNEKAKEQANYPFILAFENSLKDDYFTEKYFQGLQTSKSIMIYLGSKRIEDYAPTNELYYIHALDYSPIELASYMNYLLENQEEFMKYLTWKKKGEILKSFKELEKYDFTNTEKWICRTCEHYHKFYDFTENK